MNRAATIRSSKLGADGPQGPVNPPNKKEVDRMLEHIRQSVPGLRGVEVQLALPYDTGDETSILIRATMADPHLPYDRTEDQLSDWKIDTFPPDVCRYFIILTVYGPAHEG
jgi:hypothetical protein